MQDRYKRELNGGGGIEDGLMAQTRGERASWVVEEKERERGVAVVK